jgi:hypothetical protein
MAGTQTPPGPIDIADSKRRVQRKKRIIAIAAAAVALAALIAGVSFANEHWPYRYQIVKPLLEQVLGSQLTITHYHRTYFPNPGFVATGLILHRKTAPDIAPLGSAEELVVQGRWTDLLLLRKRVQLVEISALHLEIPAAGTRANHEDFPFGSASDFAGAETLIEQLKIHHGVLDILRPNAKRYRFPIVELDVSGFQKGRANTYAVDMQNAKPWGRIQSIGRFGPLNSENLADTPVSGTFTFSSVRLHDVGDIGGTLFSSGNFTGQLGSIEASVTSQTGDFRVSDGRPTPINADAICDINGLTGEVVVQSVVVRSGKTTVIAKGAVQGAPKVTNFDFDVVNGRAQDVMRPFVHGEVPITGAVWLHGHAYVAPTQRGVGFLERLRVDGTFDVPGERLTDQTIEQKLSAFSERALGQKSDSNSVDLKAPTATDAISSLQGPVVIRHGIVASPHLQFEVAGAHANLNGTFNFHNENVHLLGTLVTESDISHVTTGFKSFLLKPVAPFLKKNNTGAMIPIAVTGGPGNYSVTSDFSHEK